MKKLMVFGAGLNQISLIEKGKKLGCHVIVANGTADAPAKHLADEYIQIQPLDRAAALSAAEERGVDAICTDMSDMAVPTVAYVAEKLNLRGAGLLAAETVCAKARLRDFLRARLPSMVPRFLSTGCVEEAARFARQDLGGRAIVKPSQSQGSRGVSILGHDHQQWRRQLEAALQESADQRLLVEEFIEGEEYSVEGFVREGHLTNLVATKKYHYPENDCLDFRNTFLGDIPMATQSALFEANSQLFRALGAQSAITHVEYMVTRDNRCYVMDAAVRGAGGGISSHIVPHLTNFDPQQALLQTLLGVEVEIQPRNYRNKFAILRFFPSREGVVKSFSLDQEAIRDALHYSISVSPDQALPGIPRDSRDRVGYFIVAGETPELARQKESKVEAALKLVYADTL